MDEGSRASLFLPFLVLPSCFFSFYQSCSLANLLSFLLAHDKATLFYARFLVDGASIAYCCPCCCILDPLSISSFSFVYCIESTDGVHWFFFLLPWGWIACFSLCFGFLFCLYAASFFLLRLHVGSPLVVPFVHPLVDGRALHAFGHGFGVHGFFPFLPTIHEGG